MPQSMGSFVALGNVFMRGESKMETDCQPRWDEKMVMAYLRDAAAIHRRLPAVRVQGFRCLWPEPIKDDWSRLTDLVNGRSRLGSPMPPEVTFQETVMEWLRWLERHDQQIVWMRANNIPWKILVDEFGQSKPTLWRRLQSGLADMASRLNQTEDKGQLFSRLRHRAHALPLTR